MTSPEAEGRRLLAEWKAQHYVKSVMHPWCAKCLQDWPCMTARLIAAVEEAEVRLKSLRAAGSQALDALESDADLDARRAAFERLQDEYEDVDMDGNDLRILAKLTGGTDAER